MINMNQRQPLNYKLELQAIWLRQSQQGSSFVFIMTTSEIFWQTLRSQNYNAIEWEVKC